MAREIEVIGVEVCLYLHHGKNAHTGCNLTGYFQVKMLSQSSEPGPDMQALHVSFLDAVER